MKSFPAVGKPEGTGTSTSSGFLANPSNSMSTLVAYSFSSSMRGTSRKSCFCAAVTLTTVGVSNAPAGTSTAIPSGEVKRTATLGGATNPWPSSVTNGVSA